MIAPERAVSGSSIVTGAEDARMASRPRAATSGTNAQMTCPALT